MTEPSQQDNNRADIEAGQNPESTVGAPRWVKVLGLVALVVIVLVIVILLAAGGKHGPGRHTLSADGSHASALRGHGP